jgi:probable rRNA maturation factor
MYYIIIQHVADKKFAPSSLLLRKWAKVALASKMCTGQVTIRLVDTNEMSLLNSTYRHKQGPTNVLSFPLMLPEEVTLKRTILGDIVICTDIVNQEAKAQHKSQEAHFAHMVIHGIFHLLGYDHETRTEAQIMKSLEKNVMRTLGFPNPYARRIDSSL